MHHGLWELGSAVAKIIGNNVKKLQKFASMIKMWAFEEMVDRRKLTDIINNDHKNMKYLSGHKLPDNVVAVPNLQEAIRDVEKCWCSSFPTSSSTESAMRSLGKCPKKRRALIKDIDEGPQGLKLISDIIQEKMGIDISVLMGAKVTKGGGGKVL